MTLPLLVGALDDMRGRRARNVVGGQPGVFIAATGLKELT